MRSIKIVRVCSMIQFISGLLLISSGIGFYFMADPMFKQQIQKNVFLSNESTSFERWSAPSKGIYRKYYLFSVQNGDDIVSGKADKPKVLEMGPYVYEEVMEKKNIEFIDEDTIRYAPISTLYFVQNMSNGTLDDLVTFFNVPAWGFIESIDPETTGFFKYKAINGMLKLMGVKLFNTRTVNELISGYEDPFLKMAMKASPDKVKTDIFGLMGGRNGTFFENITMNTGSSDVTQIGQILEWNDKKKMDFWKSPSANKLKGTDGTIFAPFIKRDTTLYAFSPDMCRSYPLEFLKENQVNGVKTYDFHLPENVFWNDTENPLNKGYCESGCIGNGLHNISSCGGGVSSFISQPHFLNADAKFYEAIDGVNPDKNKHDYILQFEPNTAAALHGVVRLMISFYYTRNENIDLVKNVKTTVLPMVWFEEEISLDEDTINQLGTVSFISELFVYLPIALVILGIACLIVSAVLFIIQFSIKKNKSKQMMESKFIVGINNPVIEYEPEEKTEANMIGY